MKNIMMILSIAAGLSFAGYTETHYTRNATIFEHTDELSMKTKLNREFLEFGKYRVVKYDYEIHKSIYDKFFDRAKRQDKYE